MRKSSLVLLGIIFLLAPLHSSAAPAAPGPAVSNDVMRLAPEIKITEPVSRDLLVLGGSIEINQPVSEDILALGGTVIIKSDVAGDVRALGGTVIIDGRVGGNVSAAGGNIRFGPASTVAGSVALWAGAADLSGDIKGDVEARVGTFLLAGKIGGNLHYQTEKEIPINPEQVTGRVFFEKTTARGQDNFRRFYSFFSLVSLFGALVVGLIFVSFLPRTMRGAITQSIKNPMQDWLWGLLALSVTPLAVIFLFFTLIGLPLALVLLAAYLFALYIAKVITGLVLGTYIVGVFKGRPGAERFSLLWLMVIGVACLWIIGRAPVVGLPVQLAAAVWGLGILGRLKWRIIRQIED